MLSVRLSPDNLSETKPRILSLLAAVDGVLDRLAAHLAAHIDLDRLLKLSQ